MSRRLRRKNKVNYLDLFTSLYINLICLDSSHYIMLTAPIFTTNKGVVNSINYLIYMIEYDKNNPNNKRYHIRECDYSLMASTFFKHYFSSDKYIIAPEHAVNDNVRPDVFIAKANVNSDDQWYPWLFCEMKNHTAVSLRVLISEQMSKQAEGLFGRYDVPNNTIWAVACIGSHISFFKYNPTFTPGKPDLQGFVWVPYPMHAGWSMDDYKEYDAFPTIIDGELVASYNLLNLEHQDILHWYFNNMSDNAAI